MTERAELRDSLLSIGHSNHSLERFLELLRAHNVEAVELLHIRRDGSLQGDGQVEVQPALSQEEDAAVRRSTRAAGRKSVRGGLSGGGPGSGG